MFRRRRGWPGNATVVRTVHRGVDPQVADTIGALDLAWGRGLRGGTGTVRIGLPSSTFARWNGEGGRHHSFLGGGIGLGTAHPHPGFNRALPMTSAPAASTSNNMAGLLGAVGL